MITHYNSKVMLLRGQRSLKTEQSGCNGTKMLFKSRKGKKSSPMTCNVNDNDDSAEIKVNSGT